MVCFPQNVVKRFPWVKTLGIAIKNTSAWYLVEKLDNFFCFNYVNLY